MKLVAAVSSRQCHRDEVFIIKKSIASTVRLPSETTAISGAHGPTRRALDSSGNAWEGQGTQGSWKDSFHLSDSHPETSYYSVILLLITS